MLFNKMNIPDEVLKGIEAAGFTECTPVQNATLPSALKGEDVAAQAQTGTGKTAAFLIAVFSRMLLKRKPALTGAQAKEEPGTETKSKSKHKQPPSPQVLIIAPTRELVAQIHAEALILGKFTGFRMLAIYGGIDYLKQRDDLARDVDVVVGTPGRLIDYLKQKVYSLKQTEFLIIDEADRMFDMGFISDLRFILRRMQPFQKRQSMLFSATLSHRVMELCYEHMNLSDKISLTPEKITVEKVTQELYHVGKTEKIGLLLGVLRDENMGRSLIFVNTKTMAEQIVDLLNANNYKAAAITGDIAQKTRQKILSNFKAGSLPILVATDVASRGLHIDGVTHVINYDLPQDSEDYVHRIGRTARAGADGKAISLACEQYVYSLESIEDYINQKIPTKPVEDHLIVKHYKKPPRRRRKELSPKYSKSTSTQSHGSRKPETGQKHSGPPGRKTNSDKPGQRRKPSPRR